MVCLKLAISLLILIGVESQLPNYPIIQQITQPIDHAEGPSWDGRKNILFYVDIHTGVVHAFDFETQQGRSIKLNGEVTPVVQTKDPNILIVGLNRSVVAVNWDGKGSLGAQTVLTTVSQQFPTSRFNDGKADKQGRLWFGTMGFEGPNGVVPNEGVLYRITCANLDSPSVAIAPVNISNGLAWNKANDKFYYIDTPSNKVVEYNYIDSTGEINFNRVVFDVTQHSILTGGPDGMTIDENDNLWVALFGGGGVVHVNSKTGALLKIIALPARDVTSAMWGGPNLDILFVTTSRIALSQDQRRQYPAAGSVYAISNLGTKGLPVFEATVGLDKLQKRHWKRPH